jgi:hypothetical protein
MTAVDTTKKPHPSKVGKVFLKQYYHLLTKNPEELHRFYNENSSFCHGNGSQMEEPIHGQKNINEKIISKKYGGAHVDLDHGSIDCQHSLDGGVIVLAAGVITLKNATPKPFVQTFFLAVQPNGYFVLNDILRLLDVNTSTVPASPKDTKTPQAAIGIPVAPKSAQVTEPAKTPASPAPAKAVSPKKAATPSPSPAMVASPKASPPSAPAPATTSPIKKAEPAAVPSPKAAPTQAEVTKSAPPANPAAPAEPVIPAAPAAPKSWAQLFADGSAPASAPVSSASAPAPTAKPVPKQTPFKTVEYAETKEKSKFFSLYIKDIPAETKESDLRELFNQFGEIGGINVATNRGYAFVDFVQQESVRAALADGKEYSLFGKVIHVGEKTERKGKSITLKGYRKCVTK